MCYNPNDPTYSPTIPPPPPIMACPKCGTNLNMDTPKKCNLCQWGTKPRRTKRTPSPSAEKVEMIVGFRMTQIAYRKVPK